MYKYYDIEIPPPLADFNVEHTYEILKNPVNYEVGLIRFDIPNYKIPLFFFKDNEYSVSITNNTETKTEFLVFQQNETSLLYGKNAIWTVSQFINIINNALETAYNNITNKAPTSDPPFLYFEPTSKLISLYCQNSYVGNLNIYFNANLYDKIYSLSSFYDTLNPNLNLRARIDIYDNLINRVVVNGDNYLRMTQDFVVNMKTLSKILFYVYGIPVRPQIQGTQQNNTKSLLYDYYPDKDNNILQYLGDSTIDWKDLKSNDAITSVDIDIRWVDNDGSEYPIYINQNANIKLLFREKL